MVWGSFLANSTGTLQIIEERMNGKMYRDILNLKTFTAMYQDDEEGTMVDASVRQ